MALTAEAFDDIFINYYESLYGYAFSILNSGILAEESVSDVFYKLWSKKEKIEIDTSLAGYLYKSVYNTSMDKIRHNKVRKTFQQEVLHQSRNTGLAENAVPSVHTKDLEEKLRIALLQLPEQCRTVFQLNRMEELSYRDIASRLGISIKTVEAHISKALRRLRVSLAEFLTLLIVLLWH